MVINTELKLKFHLKALKLKMLNQGMEDVMLYPTFCAYYDKNKNNYDLPKEVVLNMACEILIEED